MAKQQGLRVEIDGKRRYITVPSGRANDLHRYLRNNGIRSAPPEPAHTGYDNIELDKDNDIARIQTILNAWS
jgi:hypothetical protein